MRTDIRFALNMLKSIDPEKVDASERYKINLVLAKLYKFLKDTEEESE